MSTKRSKRYQEAAKLVIPNKNYSITEAVETMKSFPAPKFDPTVTVSFHLTVDPRKSDQMVRGSVSLPNGTGKNVRVLVFAQGDAAKAINTFAKASKKAEYKVAILDGAILSADEIRAIGELPPRDQLLAKLLGTINAAGSALARVIQAYVDKENGGSEEPAA